MNADHSKLEKPEWMDDEEVSAVHNNYINWYITDFCIALGEVKKGKGLNSNGFPWFQSIFHAIDELEDYADNPIIFDDKKLVEHMKKAARQVISDFDKYYEERKN